MENEASSIQEIYPKLVFESRQFGSLVYALSPYTASHNSNDFIYKHKYVNNSCKQVWGLESTNGNTVLRNKGLPSQIYILNLVLAIWSIGNYINAVRPILFFL